MTTSLDTSLRPKAEALIERYGKPMTYGAAKTGTYDPATSEGTDGYDWYAVKGIVTGNRKARDQEVFRKSEFNVIFAGTKFVRAPKTDDLVIIDSAKFRVLLVSAVYTGELVGIYDVTCAGEPA